ncbi:acyltransferase [Paenibacillus sp. MMO-58]|uniref:acyltransferase n=1 Tax=Paenibacillus sp. MMO-58 TaxID=3081290 RepID=UPI0030195E3A
MKIIFRVFIILEKKLFSYLNPINVRLYMKWYNAFLRKRGVQIVPYHGQGYIDPSAYFDSSDYRLISIGDNVTISKEVMLLTHDYSIYNGLNAIGQNPNDKRYRFLKKISIGSNTFIGARSFILPGTTIGSNVIIGAASVVKGNISDNTVWAGNPAKKIMSIEDFASRHINKNDYFEV